MTETKTAPAVLNAGDMVHQYRLEAPLARGTGTGAGAGAGSSAPGGPGGTAAWTATDTKLDRSVVLRRLPPAQAADPECVAAFRKECKQLVRASPKSPHLAPVVDFVEDAAGLFCVTEHVEAEPLDALIAADRLDGRTRLRVLAGLLQGLAEAHAAGVAHRDLRPSAVLVENARPSAGMPGLTPPAETRLTDFALGLGAGAGGAGTVPMGTTKYMAPETFAGHPPDARSDLYSAGMIAFELLAGKAAFPKTFAEVVADPRTAHLRWMQWHGSPVEAPALMAVRPDSPEARAASALVGRLLAKDPARRPASAAEAAAEAVALMSAAPGAAVPVAAPAPVGNGTARAPSLPVPVTPSPAAARPPTVAAGAIVPAGAAPLAVRPPTVVATASPAAVQPYAPAPGAVPQPAGEGDGDDTRRLPAVATPSYLKPAFIAAAVGLAAAVVLAVLGLNKGDPVAPARKAAMEAFNGKKWSEARAAHEAWRDAARAADRPGSADEAELADLVARLCDCFANERENRAKALADVEKVIDGLDRLASGTGPQSGTAKVPLAMAKELQRRGEPEVRFNTAMGDFAKALAARNRGEANKQHALLTKIAQDNKLGRTRELSAANRLRQAYENMANNRERLDKVIAALDAAAATQATQSELDAISAGQGEIVKTLEEVNIAEVPELAPVSADLLTAKRQAAADQEHINSLMTFYGKLGEARAKSDRAVSAFNTGDKKNVAHEALSGARAAYIKAGEVAERVRNLKLGGIPEARVNETREGVALCDDVETYLGIAAPPLVEKKNNPAGGPPTTLFKVDTLTDQNLKDYRAKLASIQTHGNLERLQGGALLNALEAEAEKRDKVAASKAGKDEFDKIGKMAEDAARAGDIDAEIDLREKQRTFGTLPAAVEQRIADLKQAKTVLPRIETAAKPLADALKAAETALKDPDKLIAVEPGKPAGVKLEEVVSPVEEARKGAEAAAAEVGALGVFKTVLPLKEKAEPFMRDFDAAGRLSADLSAIRTGVLRFQDFLDEASKRTGTNKKPFLLDAKTTARELVDKAPAGSPAAELRSRLKTQLTKLADYEEQINKLELVLSVAERSHAQAQSSSQAEARDSFLKTARTNLENARNLLKELPFPLDKDRKDRMEALDRKLKGN